MHNQNSRSCGTGKKGRAQHYNSLLIMRLRSSFQTLGHITWLPLYSLFKTIQINHRESRGLARLNKEDLKASLQKTILAAQMASKGNCCSEEIKEPSAIKHEGPSIKMWENEFFRKGLWPHWYVFVSYTCLRYILKALIQTTFSHTQMLPSANTCKNVKHES